MSSYSQNPDRDAYIAGLRELADWLEQHADVAVPRIAYVSLPLTTNANVEAFAAAANAEVVVDEDGNAKAALNFGPIEYYAYGYADWDRHIAEHYESQARTWADKHDMVIQPREGGAE